MALSLVLLATACSHEPVFSPTPKMKLVRIGATVAESPTKTVLTPGSENSYFVARWENGDRIHVRYSFTDAIFPVGVNGPSSYAGALDMIWNEETSCFEGYLPEVESADWTYSATYPYGSLIDENEFFFDRNRPFNGDGDYDDRMDIMSTNTVVVENSAAGRDTNGDMLIFPFERKTALVYFDLSSNISENIIAATLKVTGSSPLSAHSVVLSNDGILEPVGDGYNDVSIDYSLHPLSASSFRLYFNVLPVAYESMTLTVFTENHKLIINRKSPGTYEAGNIYTATIKNIDASKWKDRATTETGDTLFAYDFAGDPVFGYNGSTELYDSEILESNNAGGSAPELLLDNTYEANIIPNGPVDAVEITFRTNKPDNLVVECYYRGLGDYKKEFSTTQDGLCRCAFAFQAPVAELRLCFTADGTDVYIDDITVKSAGYDDAVVFSTISAVYEDYYSNDNSLSVKHLVRGVVDAVSNDDMGGYFILADDTGPLLANVYDNSPIRNLLSVGDVITVNIEYFGRSGKYGMMSANEKEDIKKLNTVLNISRTVHPMNDDTWELSSAGPVYCHIFNPEVMPDGESMYVPREDYSTNVNILNQQFFPSEVLGRAMNLDGYLFGGNSWSKYFLVTGYDLLPGLIVTELDEENYVNVGYEASDNCVLNYRFVDMASEWTGFTLEVDGDVVTSATAVGNNVLESGQIRFAVTKNVYSYSMGGYICLTLYQGLNPLKVVPLNIWINQAANPRAGNTWADYGSWERDDWENDLDGRGS